MDEWFKERDDLVIDANAEIFSKDIILTDTETRCDAILKELRRKLLEQDPVIVTGDYSEKLDSLKQSKVHAALNLMPKPGLLHVHATATARVEWLVKKLCYYDFVYLSQADFRFKVTKDPAFCEPGYIKVN